jgi:hypothetical protein
MKRLKLKNLLKLFFVFVLLAALFKMQYSDTFTVPVTKTGYYAGSIQPFSPAGENPLPERPLYQKDLIRFEILFFLFISLLVYFIFSFSIFQFRPIRIWIREKEIPNRYVTRRSKDRAPPYWV